MCGLYSHRQIQMALKSLAQGGQGVLDQNAEVSTSRSDWSVVRIYPRFLRMTGFVRGIFATICEEALCDSVALSYSTRVKSCKTDFVPQYQYI